MPTTIQFKPLSKYRILLSSRSFHHVSLCARKSLNQFTKTSYVYFSVLFSDVKLVVKLAVVIVVVATPWKQADTSN